MTRSEKKVRLDAFLSNDDNFVAVAYDDPRAVALRAKSAARAKGAAAARQTVQAASVAAAAAFEIGQVVKLKNRPFITGRIVAINGDVVTLENGKKFVAAALEA